MKKTFTTLLALCLCLPVWAQRGHHSSTSSSSTSHHSRSATGTTHHSSSHYYTNVDGNRVHRPVHTKHQPARATAQCGDGSYSFSQHHQGTCSHHGGVGSWLTH